MAKSNKPSHKAHEEHVDAGAQIENVIDRTEVFLQKHQKPLLYGLLAVVIVVGGFLGYKYLINQPHIENADKSLYVAQQLFAEGSYRTALDGDGMSMGLLEVIDEYGSTPQGRLAAHYAGICYLNLGDNLDSALMYLKKYRPASGVPAQEINAQNAGLQGVVYVAKGDFKAAANAYAKAVKTSDNLLTTPFYLKALGGAYEQLGDYKSALKAYNRIKDEFSGSQEAQTIDVLIGAAEQK